MKGSTPTPALHLFHLETGEFQPMLIDEIERAVRSGTENQARNSIDDKPKTVFDRNRMGEQLHFWEARP